MAASLTIAYKAWREWHVNRKCTPTCGANDLKCYSGGEAAEALYGDTRGKHLKFHCNTQIIQTYVPSYSTLFHLVAQGSSQWEVKFSLKLGRGPEWYCGPRSAQGPYYLRAWNFLSSSLWLTLHSSWIAQISVLELCDEFKKFRKHSSWHARLANVGSTWKWSQSEKWASVTVTYYISKQRKITGIGQ